MDIWDEIKDFLASEPDYHQGDLYQQWKDARTMSDYSKAHDLVVEIVNGVIERYRKALSEARLQQEEFNRKIAGIGKEVEALEAKINERLGIV